jgi:hypothetical protein
VCYPDVLVHVVGQHYRHWVLYMTNVKEIEVNELRWRGVCTVVKTKSTEQLKLHM